MKKVMVFGTFDGFHPGHADFFRQAKIFGDRLIVVVSRDSTIEKIKRHKPQRSEKERLKAVRNSALVGEAMLGGRGDPYDIIKKVAPDVIGLGYDQVVFTAGLEKEIRKAGLKTKIFRLKPYHPEIFHSALLSKKTENERTKDDSQ
jgi:FAD synthetase